MCDNQKVNATDITDQIVQKAVLTKSQRVGLGVYSEQKNKLQISKCPQVYLERKIVGPVGQMITSTDRQVLCSHVHLQVLEEVVVLGHTQYNNTITVAVNPGHVSGTHYMTITVTPCYSTESCTTRQVMHYKGSHDHDSGTNITRQLQFLGTNITTQLQLQSTHIMVLDTRQLQSWS